MSKLESVVSKKSWSSHGYRIVVYKPVDPGIHDKLVIKPEDELENRPSIDYEPNTGQARLLLNCDIGIHEIPQMMKYLEDADALVEELKQNKEIEKLDLL